MLAVLQNEAEVERQKNFVERSNNLYWVAMGRRRDVGNSGRTVEGMYRDAIRSASQGRGRI